MSSTLDDRWNQARFSSQDKEPGIDDDDEPVSNAMGPTWGRKVDVEDAADVDVDFGGDVDLDGK